MSGECDKCGEHALECKCVGEPSPWPPNWKELLDKCPRCDRCGTTLMPRLYCLSEMFPTIEVCHLCWDDYFYYTRKFVEDIYERNKKRENQQGKMSNPDEETKSFDKLEEWSRLNTAIWSTPIPPWVRNAFGRKSTPSLKDENKQSRD